MLYASDDDDLGCESIQEQD